MEPSKIVGLAAVATAVVVAVIAALPEKTLVRGDIVSESPHESKVAWLPDGTRVYRVPVKLRDGGVGYDEKTAAEAPCKRRPVGNRSCFQSDGGLAPELNRYPASSLSGAGCEGVACSIWLGENAEAPETKTKQER